MWDCYCLPSTGKETEVGASQLQGGWAADTKPRPPTVCTDRPVPLGPWGGHCVQDGSWRLSAAPRQPSFAVGQHALSRCCGAGSPKLTHCASHLAFSFKLLASCQSPAELLLDFSLTQMKSRVAIHPLKQEAES